MSLITDFKTRSRRTQIAAVSAVGAAGVAIIVASSAVLSADAAPVTPAPPMTTTSSPVAFTATEAPRPLFGMLGSDPKVWRAANFLLLGDKLADRFAARLWAASTLTRSEQAAVEADPSKAKALSDAKQADYTAVVREIQAAMPFASRVERDTSRLVVEMMVQGDRESLRSVVTVMGGGKGPSPTDAQMKTMEGFADAGLGMTPGPLDATYGNVVARAHAPGGVLFGAGGPSGIDWGSAFAHFWDVPGTTPAP